MTAPWADTWSLTCQGRHCSWACSSPCSPSTPGRRSSPRSRSGAVTGTTTCRRGSAGPPFSERPAMPVTVLCSKCRAKLKAPDALIGKTIKCPGCGTPNKIQAPEPAAASAPPKPAPAPAAPPPKPAPAPAPVAAPSGGQLPEDFDPGLLDDTAPKPPAPATPPPKSDKKAAP